VASALDTKPGDESDGRATVGTVHVRSACTRFGAGFLGARGNPVLDLGEILREALPLLGKRCDVHRRGLA
jgi:hypothetical protein